MFPSRTLLAVLIVAWVGVALLFALLYARWYALNASKYRLQRDLIHYPFIWRDARLACEAEGGDPDFAFAHHYKKFLHLPGAIPGSKISPWLDTASSELRERNLEPSIAHNLAELCDLEQRQASI